MVCGCAWFYFADLVMFGVSSSLLAVLFYCGVIFLCFPVVLVLID